MLSSPRTAAIGIPSPIAGGVHGGEGDAAGHRGARRKREVLLETRKGSRGGARGERVEAQGGRG